MIHPDLLQSVVQQRMQERLQEAAHARLIHASRDTRAPQKNIEGRLFLWGMHLRFPWQRDRHPSEQKQRLGTEPCCLNL